MYVKPKPKRKHATIAVDTEVWEQFMVVCKVGGWIASRKVQALIEDWLQEQHADQRNA